MPIKDHMAYIVLVAHRSGEYLPEQNVPDLDRATVVKDIADGQYEGLTQVIEINPAEGTCRTVTEDIAWEVSARWAAEGEPLTGWRHDFIEQVIGLTAARSFPEAA